VLKHNWELGDGEFKTVQIALPWSKVKEVLRELHSRSLGGYMYANKTLEQYYWLY
jgi:hypothetical protein